MTWLCTIATIGGLCLMFAAIIMFVDGIAAPSQKLREQDSDLGFDWIDE